jgi:hypothetical protein
MTTMLAQADIGQIPANWLKEMVLFTLGSIVVMAFVISALFAALQYFLDKRRGDRPKTIEPNPLPTMKVFPSATIKDLADKHDEHGRRIDGHDKEISSLWKTMRDEDKEIRRENGEKFDAISRALGRIEGKLSGDGEGV